MIWQSSSDMLQSMGEHSFLLSVQLITEAHGHPLCPTNLVPILSLNPEFLPVRSRRLRSILVCFRQRPPHLPSQTSQWDVCPYYHLSVNWLGDWIAYYLSICIGICSSLGLSSELGHSGPSTVVKRSSALAHVVCRKTCPLTTRSWDRNAISGA